MARIKVVLGERVSAVLWHVSVSVISSWLLFVCCLAHQERAIKKAKEKLKAERKNMQQKHSESELSSQSHSVAQ